MSVLAYKIEIQSVYLQPSSIGVEDIRKWCVVKLTNTPRSFVEEFSVAPKKSGQYTLAARGWRALQGVTGSPLFKSVAPSS
jgi:hypothetical protein